MLDPVYKRILQWIAGSLLMFIQGHQNLKRIINQEHLKLQVLHFCETYKYLFFLKNITPPPSLPTGSFLKCVKKMWWKSKFINVTTCKTVNNTSLLQVSSKLLPFWVWSLIKCNFIFNQNYLLASICGVLQKCIKMHVHDNKFPNEHLYIIW